MNQSFVRDILKRNRVKEPPGCISRFVDHPFPGYRHIAAVPVGIVIEHRFAFYYWIKCKQTLMYDKRTRTRWEDDAFQPPDLISFDWHDDYDGDSGFIESELKRLNQQDEQEVSIFCWAGLQPLNDGQIGPALWLNALGNVYIVQKQKDSKENRLDHVLKDRYGKPHHVFYFQSPDELPDTFYETNSQSGVVWDIDLDYFTETEPVPDQRYTPVLSKRAINSVISPRREWMQIILGNLKAITIALEPTYTGGLDKSLDIYRQWESVLFAAPLFSNECCWREGLFDL